MPLFEPPLSLSIAAEHATQALTATSPTPRIDADVLVRHAAGVTRAESIAHPDRLLSIDACRLLAALVERRARGEPIAYLTGIREFWSLELIVSPATLIPRPETELLVERALAHIDAGARTVADLGTGSGAIALAIAHERPEVTVVATDCSAAAIAVARANAERLRLRNVRFAVGDWFAALGTERFDIVVSNPPYVRSDDPHLLRGDVRHEPRLALVAGPRGLDAIAHIAATAPLSLSPNGWLLIEHGHDQGPDVRRMFADNGYRDIQTHRDLGGHERVTQARRA